MGRVIQLDQTRRNMKGVKPKTPKELLAQVAQPIIRTLKHPKDKKVDASNTVAVANRAIDNEKLKIIETLIGQITNDIVTRFTMHDIKVSKNSAGLRDMGLIVTSLRSTLFRYFGFEHSFQIVADKMFGDDFPPDSPTPKRAG